MYKYTFVVGVLNHSPR